MIVAEPAATVVARPFASIVAIEVDELDHTTEVVKSCVEPSANVPIALNCSAEPSATDGFEGDTEIELRAAAVAVTEICAEIDPNEAVIVAEPGV